MIKPSIQQMLEIGQDCGLSSLDEAYGNYLNRYDMFFLISDFQNQMREFTEQLVILGLTEQYEGSLSLKEISIEEALKCYYSNN